jgi:phosphatidylinositol alpha-mannosyltransferase
VSVAPDNKPNNMETYKIAFVLDDSLDSTDGVQQYILTVGAWFARLGHEVHYIVGETKRTDIPNVHSIGKNVKVRFNHNRMSIPMPVSKRKIHRLLAEHEFDILHVQMPFSPTLAARVINAATPQTGIVGTFHIAPHSWLVHFSSLLLRQITRRAVKRFDEIISVSKVAQEFAWSTYGVESSIVPNTLNLQAFYNPKPLPEYRDSMNIVFLGRLVDRKGCGHLLRAVKRLHDAKALPKDCKVIICGGGPLEASLKAYVAEQGLSQIIQFEGFISEADKPRYLAAADLAVYPSTGGESFGIVLLEAMAASRGVVLAGNNPGYASVIGERPVALFDPTDEEQFAAKLQKFLEDPEAREKAHRWQQQFVCKFDVPNVADEIAVVYEQALHKQRS